MRINLNKKWFTMVELIVVIAIIAVLAVVAGLALTQFVWQARDSRVKSDIWTISRWIDTYLAQADNVSGLTGTNWTGGTVFNTGFLDNNTWLQDIFPTVPVHPDSSESYHISSDLKKYVIGWKLDPDDNGDREWYLEYDNFTLSWEDLTADDWSNVVNGIDW